MRRKKEIYEKKTVLGILKTHPDGLTIQKIADIGNMSRITATKYVHELIGEGKIVERKIGVARLLFLKERFIESIKEEEIIEKLKKKF